MLNILLLNDDALPTAKGGAAVIVDQLRKAFHKESHRVTLITTHQDPSQEEVIHTTGDTGDIYSIYCDYHLHSQHRFCLGNHRMEKILEELMQKIQPDVVHAHNIHKYLTYGSLKVAKRHTDKIFLIAHDTFLVSFNRIRGDRYEKSVINNQSFKLTPLDHLLSVGRKYWPLRNRKIRSILKEANATVVSISEAVAKLLRTHGIDSIVIPNGIPFGDQPSTQEVDIFRTKYNLTGPTILFTGRIRADKGIEALLLALPTVLKQVPSAQLLIVGEEERAASFLRSASEAVKRATKITGWISRHQMTIAYAAADVVTVPSLYLDNFPTINLEAMAACKPVVGTIFGGTPEIVLDNETGILINPREEKSYADALISFLTNPEKAARFGLAGRRRVENLFSIERQVGAYMALYK